MFSLVFLPKSSKDHVDIIGAHASGLLVTKLQSTECISVIVASSGNVVELD